MFHLILCWVFANFYAAFLILCIWKKIFFILNNDVEHSIKFHWIPLSFRKSNLMELLGKFIGSIVLNFWIKFGWVW